MAIYHCSLRVFSRERNHSAVAAAAYRSGQKLVDERTGTIHRYEKRSGVVNAFILMPESAPDRLRDRLSLWNAAEAAETRKNSRVARELIIALPYELNEYERESLTRDMAAYLVEKYRVAVDVAIHSPMNEIAHDPRNHHAHLLFTTRELTPEGLGAKTRILDDKKTGPQQIEIIREVWETLANDALSRAGHSDVKIDRRTLEAQGIERIPQIHEGKASTYAEELNKANKENEESEEGDREDDDSEDGDEGKTDGKTSGSGDTGHLSPDMSPKEGNIEKTVSEDKRDTQEKSRSEFNAEIKALNEERAEYPRNPLNDQIKEIEQEIDHLDRRVERLETLLDKTSFPQKLQRLIGDIATKAKEFLSVRIEGQAKRQLNEAEKAERHERQLARYGKIYRRSIHAQIMEMKDKIETLQSRETEYKKYRSFVTMIETEVMKVRADKAYALNTPKKPDTGATLVTTQTGKAEQGKPTGKVTDQAQVTSEPKGKVPEEYKPSPQTERLQETFSKTQSDNSQPVSTPKQEKDVQTKPSMASDKTTRINVESNPPKGNKVETKDRKVTTPSDPKDYKIKANAGTKKMLDKIQTELKAHKAREKAQKQERSKDTGKADGLKSKFRKPEQPPVNEQDHKTKTQAEAQKKRRNIPPEYRAPPYTAEELNPKSQAEQKPTPASPDEGVLGKVKKIWQQKTEGPSSSQPKQAKPRRPMSSSFNQAAGKPRGTRPSMKAKQKPDLK